MQIKFRRTSLARPSNRSGAATRLIANIFQGQMLSPDAVKADWSPRELSRQSPTLTASGPFRCSQEIQPGINTHRSRSGQRFCPIDF